MLEALCLLIAAFCHDGDRPPSVAPPKASVVVATAAPKAAPPALKTAKVKPAQFFDASCEVQPPDDLKHHYWSAARRYPGGATDCELAKQGKAECDVCWVKKDYGIKSPAGAIGVGQFLPGTAQELGIDPYDPGSSIHGQARYLRWCRQRWTAGLGGRTEFDIRAFGLACYNWGLGNLRRDQGRNGWVLYRDAEPHMPGETCHYVRVIEGEEYVLASTGRGHVVEGARPWAPSC